MEEKSNPEVQPNHSLNSMPYEDDYSRVQKEVDQQNQPQQVQFVPETPIDTAHLLISDSDTSSLMKEIDKEIKLANLDQSEKSAIYQFIGVWNDLQFLKNQQEIKKQEAQVVQIQNRICPKELYENQENIIFHQTDLFDLDGEDSVLEHYYSQEKNPSPNFFDLAGAFKKARFIATLSRGKYGFERIQQIRTISEYKVENNDVNNQTPGFMQRFAGGFKR